MSDSEALDPFPPPPEPLLQPIDEEPPRRRRSRRALFVVIPVVVLLAAGSLVRLPYFVLSPGPAEDVVPLIRITQHRTYATTDHLLLTSVYISEPTIYQALWGWLDSTQAVVPQHELLGPSETQQQYFKRALSDQGQSQIDAAYVALSAYANYPAEHGKGVLIESTIAKTPADGKLFPGDLIESVDGTPVEDTEQLGRIIRSAGVGHPLSFRVTAGGESHDISLSPVMVKGVDHPVIGVVSLDNFPFPVRINSGQLGGPSAGLMWTLGLIDLLTPGDLSGGRIIAGTGTIDIDGKVGPIGGIQQKVVAAQRAGAKVFFAPRSEANEAEAVAGGIVIVPVNTYKDALSYLQAHS